MLGAFNVSVGLKAVLILTYTQLSCGAFAFQHHPPPHPSNTKFQQFPKTTFLFWNICFQPRMHIRIACQLGGGQGSGAGRGKESQIWNFRVGARGPSMILICRQGARARPEVSRLAPLGPSHDPSRTHCLWPLLCKSGRIVVTMLFKT